MRILHVITSLHFGGAERLMVDLLPLLMQSGNNDVELLLFDGTETPFYNELKSKGVVIHCLTKGGNIYNPKLIIKLLGYVDQYDVIHTHNTACQFFVPIARAIKNSQTILITTEHNSTNRRRDKWWFKPLDRWMYRQYASIICIADQTQKNLEQYIGSKKTISTIYNGVDIRRFLKPVKDISGQSRFVITMVAAFRKQKDHETLLRAMTHLPDNSFLQFVGSGITEPLVKDKCRELGLNDRVIFMGARSDVSEIMEQSDIIVLSSHWEGLSLSSIEGMASGRPFIASDVDGLHEMASGAGILFPHGDDKELAKQIQYLCEHPKEYQEVAQRCQKRAKKYDISVMASNYLELYQRITETQCSIV